MNPYYQDDSVTIYHGDCREVLPSIAADVVVTDPPYGVGMRDYEDNFLAGTVGVDSSPGNLAAVFTSPRRVYDLATRLASWKYERLLWMHKAADIAAPWHGWCMNSEAILILSRRGYVWPKPHGYRTDMYSVGPWERAGHPNGKPLAVISDLVKRIAIPAAVVLDPFMGSGTTLLAARDLNRQAIGIEIEERYCEIAATRCQQKALVLSA